jgi:Holliday junction resolvasome RuvABC endonuclease subunit
MGENTVVIGIDPSSTHMALVVLYPDNLWEIVAVKKIGKSGPESCHQARLLVLATIDSSRKKCESADIHCFYEMPVLGRGGFRSTIVQCFTSGAVQGAIYERNCSAHQVNVSSWKKAVVGKGNADKTQVAEYLRLRWNAVYSAAEGNQDIYDAAAIALYGRQVLAKGVAQTSGVPQ